MRIRSRWLFAILSLLIVLAPVDSLPAGDEHFDPGTLFVFSIDNVTELKKGVEASQFGQFLEDPAIEALVERLEAAMTRMVESAVQQRMTSTQSAEGPDSAEMVELMKQYMDCVMNNAIGRVAIAFGFRPGEGEKQRPDCIVHVQGGECFKELHDRLLDVILQSDKSLVSAAMEVEGVAFRGIAAPEEKLNEEMENPDGLFFGSNGEDHYMILNQASFQEYMQAARSEAGGTSGKRLGDDRFYQQMQGQVGNGQIGLFVRLAPLWKLLEQSPAAEVMPMLKACGLTDFDGIAARYHFGERGLTGNSYLAVHGRRGLLDLLPDTNASLAMPAFVPSNVMSFSTVRLKLDRALEIIMAVTLNVAGEQATQGVQAQLAGIEQSFGIDVPALLSNLEGSLAVLQFPRRELSDEEREMMAVSVDRLAFALRLKDPAPMEDAIKTLVAHPMYAERIKVVQFLGKTLYVMEPDDDIDPELTARPGTVPTPGIVIDGEWLLIAVYGEDLREMVRASVGEESARLAGLPEFQKLRSQVGSSGMGMGYQDYGKTISQLVELLRPILGSSSGMMPFFDPAMLPDGKLFEKYFGKSISVMHINEDGSLTGREWSPNRRFEPAPKPAGEPEEL